MERRNEGRKDEWEKGMQEGSREARKGGRKKESTERREYEFI